jgi:hypothetical protein
LTTRGEIIPRRQEGTKKTTAVTQRMRTIKWVWKTDSPIQLIRGEMEKTARLERKRIHPRVGNRGNRSAIIPPRYAPPLIPASTTPMMLVHVKRETPT